MKSNALLVFSMLLTAIAVSCNKDGKPSETTSEDESLAGVEVAVGESGGPYKKLFMLNEGKMGSNNASVDFLRFSDGKYVRNAFAQMNPTQVLGLGDTGNDLKIHNDQVWAVINGSSLVEVFSPKDEKHIATIPVPSPRNIAFEGEYAYVTSYSGAYYGGPDILGAVYQISTKTFREVAHIDVGYQPEGIASYKGKLFVANGGGLKSDGSYDNRIMVLSANPMKVEKEIPVEINLDEIYIDDAGNGYVSTFGNFWSIHSGLYAFNAASGTASGRITGDVDVKVSCMAGTGGSVYAIGTEDEWNWDPKAVKKYRFYTVSASGKATVRDFPSTVTTPYSLCVNPENGDIYVGDAGDYLSPGSVICFDKNLKQKWIALAGINPGHFALY